MYTAKRDHLGPRKSCLLLVAAVMCTLTLAPAHAQPVQWIPRQPTARHSHAMAYDAARGVTVLFGGSTDFDIGLTDETWEWNGTAWNQRFVGGPWPNVYHALAYDAARGVRENPNEARHCRVRPAPPEAWYRRFAPQPRRPSISPSGSPV